MSKYLYVNGCSFTAGHDLTIDDTWPFKLGELLKVKVINRAVNGNSMYSICHNTFHHLQELSPEDTTVVIGMTWETRQGFLYDNSTFNITPGDIGDNLEKKWKDKLGKNRICIPWSLDLDRRIKKDFIKNLNSENFKAVYDSFVSFRRTLVKYDQELIRNTQLEYKYHLTMLETYLKAKGYKYLFVDFQKYYYPENFVSFSYTENPTSHPTAEDCTMYANFIYNKLTNE